MKFLSFLAPVLGLLKNFGFILRLIGLVIGFVLFQGFAKDLMFLSSSKGAKAMTVEQLMELPKSEIPRYIKLENLAMASDMYVASVNEETGEIADASYPVYSANQLSSSDSITSLPEAHVIVKDNNFDENSMAMIMSVDGMYDNESFEEVKDILVMNGVKVSNNAVLIDKKSPPTFGSTLAWTLVLGLLSLLILLSFIPSRMLGIVEPVEEEQEIEESVKEADEEIVEVSREEYERRKQEDKETGQ